jgi:hypothetical protein
MIEITSAKARRITAAAVLLLVFTLGGTASAGRPGGGGKKDTTPPKISISSPLAAAILGGTILVFGSASDNVGVANVAVSVDGGSYQPAVGTSSWSYSLDTKAYGDASHTITVRAKDAAANQASASVSLSFKNSDTTPPAVTIGAPAAGALVRGSVSISGSASDAGGGVASVAVSVDDGPPAPATGTSSWVENLDTTRFQNGVHAIAATATDLAGNSTTARVSVTVDNADTTPPSLAVSAPSPGATVSATVTVAGTAADDTALSGVAVAVDGGTYAPAQGTTNWSLPLNTSAYSNGSHTISVKATDGSGNVSLATVPVDVQNGLPPGIAQQLITPEGATIQIASDVTGWTTQQVYDLLKPNALELAKVGPGLTVRLQTQYPSSTSAGASQSNGVFTNFQAAISLQAKPGTVFTDRPDYILAHEYGHAWTLYHLYMSQHEDWTKYLVARGIATDPRVDSTYNWSKVEMIAEDYRMLFGTSAAVSQSFYINPDVPDPRSVAGLRDFFLNVWATP